MKVFTRTLSTSITNEASRIKVSSQGNLARNCMHVHVFACMHRIGDMQASRIEALRLQASRIEALHCACVRVCACVQKARDCQVEWFEV